MIQGQPWHDIDIATSAPYSKIVEIFNQAGFPTKEVGKAFGVVLVQHGGFEFEVAKFRKDEDCNGRHPSRVTEATSSEDAWRRDFTMNAVFYDPVMDEYVDPVCGFHDAKNRQLRFVGDVYDRIREDYIRILRYARFFNQGYVPDGMEKGVVDSLSLNLFENVAPERIRIELMEKILPSIISLKNFTMFDHFPILFERVLFPDVARLRGVHQSPKWHPEGDAFIHTMEVVKNVIRDWDASPNLILAALFHDVGKAYDTVFQDGDWHSPGHENTSTAICRAWMEKLKFSNEDIDKVCWLVKNHMKLHFSGMKKASLKRLTFEGNIDELLVLTHADCMAGAKDFTEYNDYKEKIDRIKEEMNNKLPDPLVSGKDLIDAGIKPGPVFKLILNKVYEHQLDNESLLKEHLLKEAIDEAKAQG
jgi:poly(A) polymerase